MRKLVLVGTALVLTTMLMFSCNKNRFDFENFNSVEASGQWKFPIGTMKTDLGKMLDQFGANGLFEPGDSLKLKQIHYPMENIINGKDLMRNIKFDFNTDLFINNPIYYPDSILPLPMVDTLEFKQIIPISSDSLSAFEKIKIRSGSMMVDLSSTVFDILSFEISSPDIFNGPNPGDTLHSSSNMVSLDGVTFTMNSSSEDSLVFHYRIVCELVGNVLQFHQWSMNVGLSFQTDIEEIAGHLNEFVYEFDTVFPFSLPFNSNINGVMELIGVELQINELNTFGNLYADLQLDKTELYGDHTDTARFFHNYPFVLGIQPAQDYIDIFPAGETVDVKVNTAYNTLHLAGMVDFNPEGQDNLISITDQSKLGLIIDAMIPLQFNIPNVTYQDTMDITMPSIATPDLVEKVSMKLSLDSELPFDLSVQLCTLDSNTGEITDSLLTEEQPVKGSYDGTPVTTDFTFDVTQERLKHLLTSNQLVMKFGLSTAQHTVWLNRANGLSVTLKGDVIYNGELNLEQ